MAQLDLAVTEFIHECSHGFSAIIHHGAQRFAVSKTENGSTTYTNNFGMIRSDAKAHAQVSAAGIMGGFAAQLIAAADAPTYEDRIGYVNALMDEKCFSQTFSFACDSRHTSDSDRKAVEGQSIDSLRPGALMGVSVAALLMKDQAATLEIARVLEFSDVLVDIGCLKKLSETGEFTPKVGAGWAFIDSGLVLSMDQAAAIQTMVNRKLN